MRQARPLPSYQLVPARLAIPACIIGLDMRPDGMAAGKLYQPAVNRPLYYWRKRDEGSRTDMYLALMLRTHY